MVIKNMEVIVTFWVGFFIVFLIFKSTNKESIKRNGVTDPVLNRKVPMMVFLKNKSLVKKIYTSEQSENEFSKQVVRLQA